MFNGDATVSNDLKVSNDLTVQLLNLLTQLTGTDSEQAACLKTQWNKLSTC